MELLSKDGDKKNLIFGKYKLTKIIGSGSFGYVYEGINMADKKSVAVKVEKKDKGVNLLEKESFYLYSLKGTGVPEVISFGYSGKYNILVQTLLGESLGRIFYNNNNYFSLKDICMFSIQILHRIEFVHSKYIIHRDIKPENFLIGKPDKYLIYIIDFGLSKKYKSSRTNKHVQFRLTKKFTGTARYASLNSIRGAEQSRRDDLEAIGYMLLYFFNHGKLPWQGVSCKAKAEKYVKIYSMKKHLNFDIFCKDMPKQIITYMKYCRELEFEQKPDYDYLRNLFEEVLKSKGMHNDLHFSWIQDISILKNYHIIKNKINSVNLGKRKESPQSRIFKKLENSKEKNKEKESDIEVKSLKTNNSLQNIQNIVLLKANAQTPQFSIHKRFNSSGDNAFLQNNNSENYKSGIAQYNISLEDEDQIINKAFTTNKIDIIKIKDIINKNREYSNNNQNINKDNLYHFSDNVKEFNKSSAVKKMNQNKMNDSTTEQNNGNNEIKKQNSSFYLHNRIFSSNSILKNPNNNIASPNILKSFSFIKTIKPNIEENKENKENNNLKINLNDCTIKNLKNQNMHNFQKTNFIKNNTISNTTLNTNPNISINNQIKKNIYNFKNKFNNLKFNSFKNNIKKQNTSFQINKNKNNTYVSKNIPNNNTNTKNKQNYIGNQTKTKKMQNNTVKKEKKGKIIKKKVKISNIQIPSNNLNCRSTANIFKKYTSPNNTNTHQNNPKISFIQNINNKRLKRENAIKTDIFTNNLNLNNIEGKINKVKNMNIHYGIKKKESLTNYKKLTTQPIFKNNVKKLNTNVNNNNFDIFNSSQSRINKYKNLRHKNAKKYENYPTQKSLARVTDISMQKARITNGTINSTINNYNTVNNTINTNNNNNTIISIYNNYNVDKNNNRYGFIHKKINGINIALDTLHNIKKETCRNNNYSSYNGYKVKLNNYKSYIHLNPRKNTTLNNMPSINHISNYTTLNSRINNDSNHYNSQVISNKDYSCNENYTNKKMSNYFSLNNQDNINEFIQDKMMNLSSSRANLNSFRFKKIFNENNKEEPKIRGIERNKEENCMDLNSRYFSNNDDDGNEKDCKRLERSYNIMRSNSFLYGSNFLNFDFKNKNHLNDFDFDYNRPSINRKNTDIFYRRMPTFKMNYNIYDSRININNLSQSKEPNYKNHRTQSRDYYNYNYNSNREKKGYNFFS